MKRLIPLLIASTLIAVPAVAQTVVETTTTPETTTEATSTLTSSGVSQKMYTNGVYVSESLLKANSLYLRGSTMSGAYVEQVTYMGGTAIAGDSVVDINSIRLYEGEITSSVITQTTNLSNADIQSSTLELNKVLVH